MIRSLRPRTILPPTGSGLFGVVRQTKLENERWYGGDPERFADVVDGRIFENVFLRHQRRSNTQAVETEHGVGEGEKEKGKHETALAEKGKEDTSFASSQVVGPVLPFTSLARVFETFCSQDADDGSSFRNASNYLTSSAVIEEMRTYENGLFSQLEMRERKVLRGSSGLVDDTNKDVALMLGYRTMEDTTERGNK